MVTDPGIMLRSPNPATRKEGVKALAKQQDKAALLALAKVMKNDADPEVRELARKAGQYITKKLRDEEDEGGQAQALVEEAPPPEIVVSERDQQRAREYVDEALNMQMQTDNEKALKNLAKALQLNPKLKKDNYFTSVATSVTGMGAIEAINAIENADQRKRMVRAAGQQKMDVITQKHMDEAKKFTWASVGFDFTLLSVLLLAGMIISMLVFQQTAALAAGRVDNLTPEQLEVMDPDALMQMSILSEFATGVASAITFPTMLIAAISLWVMVIVNLVILAITSHFAASTILSGTGTLPFLFYNLTTLYVSRIPLAFGILIIGAILVFLVGLPPAWTLLIVVVGGLNIIGLVLWFGTISRVGKTYNFGFGKAFLAVFIGGIGANIALSIVGTVVGALLAPVVAAFSSLA